MNGTRFVGRNGKDATLCTSNMPVVRFNVPLGSCLIRAGNTRNWGDGRYTYNICIGESRRGVDIDVVGGGEPFS